MEGYYYIQVQFSNGTMNGYLSKEQPHFNDIMDSYVFETDNGSTVWIPAKNVMCVEFRYNEVLRQSGKEDKDYGK